MTALTGAELRARFGEAPMLTMGEAGDALRKLGLRDQVHPRDVVGFRYATQEGWDESARSNLEHHGHADLGSFVTGEGVTGLVDIRHAMPEGQLTDPSKPDDWDPHTEREAAAREALKAMGYWLDRLGGSYVIGSEGRSHLLPGRTFPFLRDLEKFIKDRSQPVASKAVQSSGNTGPRDFSEQVHAHDATGPAVAPDMPVHFTATVSLAEGELGKFNAGDLFTAIMGALKAHGVPPARHLVEVVRDDDGGRYPDQRLREAVGLIHPGWTADQVNEEVERVKAQRAAGDPE